MRRFRSPSGREWITDVYRAPVMMHGAAVPEAHEYVALRFQSGGLVLDLRRFPAEWADLPWEDLVALLRLAQPPALGLAMIGASSGAQQGGT